MAVHGSSQTEMSSWVISFALLAGSLMVLGGAFQAFQGLAAILNDRFFVVGSNYIYNIDVTTWGWIHLVVGAIVAFAGMYVFSGQGWARFIGIVLASVSALANFFYIPYYPVWALLIIALDVAVIWALASYSPRDPEVV